MSKPKSKVITANHLLNGDVIYLAHHQTWVKYLKDAQVFSSTDAAQPDFTFALNQPHIAVGVYLADVVANDEGLATTHFREEMRRTGPSNYAHGKQEFINV